MPLDEAGDFGGIRGLANGIGNVDCVEIAGRKKPVNSFQGNVVGIAEIRQLPI
jgi:hypothetical protein